MALLDTHRSGRRQDFLAMEGNEELEEGEARDSNDSNYGPDLNFPHLELKLTEVLGHVRKEFEEGACNDKQGSIYGGYGTFLPTEARAPYAGPPRQSVPPSGGGVGAAGGTWAGGWKSPHKQQQQPQQHHHVVASTTHPGHVVENAAKRLSADSARDKTSPLVKQKAASETGGEPKGTNPVTLKIKMGSEATSRVKNTAIYNGLGISSSSGSEDEYDEGLSGAETSPERSPTSIIQYFLSHKLPAHLVSPLPDLVPEKSIVPRSYAPVAAKEEAGKIKSARKDKERAKDLADDGEGVKVSELDSRHARQPENDARLRNEKPKRRPSDDTFVRDEVARSSVKAPGEVGKSSTAKKPDTEFRSSDAPATEDNHGKHSKASRDEPALVEAPFVDKRKSKEADSNRPKKKQKPTGSASSFDMDAPKPRKGATTPLVTEATLPPHLEVTPSRTTASVKPAKESKKDKPFRLSVPKPAAAPELSNTSKKSAPKAGSYTDEAGSSRVKRVKSKLPKKKDIPESMSKEQPEPAVYGISVVPLEPVAPILPSAEPVPLPLEDSWVECEKCNQWRLLPSTVTAENLPEKWICKMITWLPGMNDCKFTQQETTEAVQRAYGVLPPLASAVPLEPEVKQQPIPLPKSTTAKKGLKVDEPYAEGKRKEKGKKRGVRADDPTVKDSSSEKKKKKYQADEAQASKRMKTEELQRAKYAPHPDESDLLGDEDGEVAGYRSAGQSRKQAWKGHDSSSRKDKVENRKLDRNFDEGGRSRETLEETEVRRTAPEDARASKSFRVENAKGKGIRIVASGERDYRNADDWQRTGGNQQQKVRDDEQHTDKRKKMGSGSPRAVSPSESLDGFKERQHHDEAAYDSRKIAPENHTSATEYGDRSYRRTLARDWEEGEENDEWEGPQQDAKQVFRHRNWPENNERHREPGAHHQAQEHRDREEPGKWAGRRSSSEGIAEERIRLREENHHSSRHFKSGKSYHEVEENNKPKVRLKPEGTEEQQESLCKYDNKATPVLGNAEKRELNNTERRRDKAMVKEENQNNNGTSSDQQGRQNTGKDRRKTLVEYPEAKQDSIERKECATSLIKHAKSLKHLADKLKDTVIYLQAGLKFMEGAALFERTSSTQPEYESWQLYSDTADLFRFCAGQYERGKDLTGAILAHKCAAVAKFRVLMIKSPAMSRDRTELQLAMPRVPVSNQPPIGESPSSSSASDLDNLNGQEKLQSTAGGKGAASPLVQIAGGNICLPSALQPTLTRFINNTGDMIEAFEHWNKAEAILATVLAAKMLSPEALATVEKVANIGFSDVEGLVRLVNQALEAQVAFQQQAKGR